MDRSLVSIIIPAYNSEKHLAETISSALDQTWPNKEIIIVDDGSTDHSLSIAKNFESEIVKVLYQKNKGASAARNKGLQEAKGLFIQFLDADDLLSPDKITAQVEILDQNPGKIAVCRTIHFIDGTNYSDAIPTNNEDDFLFDDNDTAHFLINLLGGFKETGSMIGVHAWLTPRDVIDKIGPWNEELTLDDDGEFFSRVLLSSNGVIRTTGFSYYRKYKHATVTLSSQQNRKAIESAFKSTLLKSTYLSANTSHPDAVLTAMYKQFLHLAVTSYIVYPQLYRQVKKELIKYPRNNFNPVLGGNLINLVTKNLGWKTARLLQYYHSKLFRNKG
ncbi:MAG: hypothetical protein JWP37_3756 [Mucilaginibacter sp.]|nr:hypothetical protein [Mucilaginibacter sp.]